MTYVEFVRSMAPLIKYYGETHFPKIVLERIYTKTKTLDQEQFAELLGLILDQCQFAPRVPQIIDYANQIRARHREGPREFVGDEAPRNEEVAKRAIQQIRSIFNRTRSI